LLYVITGEIPEQALEKRQQVRPAHISRLEKLKSDGRLVLAGPTPLVDGDMSGTMGVTGSVIIAEFDSLEAAQSWAKNDPYAQHGVYNTLHVKPFIKALP
jgi:uncharacterized protein